MSEQSFRTNALPINELPRVENPEPDDLGMTVGPDFEVLWKQPLDASQELINAIDQYAKGWEAQIADLRASGKDRDADESALGLQALRDEKAAIADGVSLLENNATLRTCFSWMNETMLRAIKLQGKPFTGWRLFQLGFILTQIRAIFERCCPDEDLTDHLDMAEVLWFSTGGGKTEAYLGIIVMAMLYDRLNERTYGVTAWMRFPLRMLSVQQFQRLSYVVAQANIIRQREKLGGHPFTIGYFTGTGTPKRITSAYESEQHDFLPSMSNGRLNELKFISDCPYCTKKNSIEMVKDLDNGRIKHICSNSKCWSNIDAEEGVYREGIRGELGIYVSDEECYRYIPTVMVGTIDKLAVISHNKRFRYFFGGATHYCPQHGFSFEGRCVHNRLIKNDDGNYTSEQCPNNSRTSQIRTHSLEITRFPGISFLIQDELHLLKENMGNFDAHYETLFSALQEANGGRKPKNLAATATIKEYEHHVTHLYQRRPRRFPVPGYTLNESFYSRVVKDDYGEPQVRRFYAGILPFGTGPTMAKATALVSSRYLTLIDELREVLRSDPDSACVALGFDSNRADDLIEHIETYLNANLMYVNSFQSLSDVVHALEDAQTDYPDRRYQQLSGKSTLEEIQSVIEHIESKNPNDQIRQIVATSVVSHGVDMHRLNFMVIAGWPKSMAEYMQSSARAGRIEPGIVLTVLNSRVLFQSNVFMNFTDYHKFMDRMVESVPINRFAPNLIERTLPGIISAWIINWAAGQEAPWGGDITKNAGQVKNALKDNAYKARQQLKDKLLSSLTVPSWLNGVFDDRVVKDFMQALDRYIEIALNQLEGMPSDIAEDYLSDALERLIGNRPMRNLRDIESQIIVLPQSQESGKVLEALGRRR
ncbi:MAG: DEAD/DEAH box helicase [Burkholderiaceae bacterium]